MRRRLPDPIETPMPILENGSAPLHQADPSLKGTRLAPAPAEPIRYEPGGIFERAGAFEIRLAADDRDLKRLQQLRYRIFYEDGRAIADRAASRTRRDLCPFDAICDHLMIVDTAATAASGNTKARVVGTYRLLRREVAERHGGFYSAGEFDLGPLLARHGQARLLELGRSCVHPDYRGKRVIELLWRGLWLYARRHRIDALIGCASLPGADPEIHRLPLSFLHHHAALGPDWPVDPWPHCRAAFQPFALDALDEKRGLLALPPLVKGYLRTGARFGRGVVLDRQFGTTDLFTVMPMAEIEERYLAHYGQPSCLSGTPVA